MYTVYTKYTVSVCTCIIFIFDIDVLYQVRVK